MDLSAIIITAAVASILANIIKVWEFVGSRLGRRRKTKSSITPTALYQGA